MFQTVLKVWVGFTIGNIIYAAARYLFTKSTGDVFAIWFGATSALLLMLLVNHWEK